MWYFAWILGLPLAAIFAVMNAMWLELKEDERTINAGTGQTSIRLPGVHSTPASTVTWIPA